MPVKCCVIGGAGFIGTHVTRLLAESGREVVVLDSGARPAAMLPSGVRYVSGDYGDRATIERVLDGVDEVIHLAYATVPQTSFEDPIHDLLANLPESVQLLQVAAEVGLSKFLFVSSGGTVYGVASSLPISEDHPTNPISPYGITKLTLEKYAGMFWAVSGLPIVIVRPANAYGEEQRAAGGQGFIAAAVHSIVRGEEFSVFGPEGTVRDYVHVSDIASGMVAALDHGEIGSTYNIGSGRGRNNLEVLSEIQRCASRDGYKLLMRTLPSRKFDVPANVLDSRRLTAVSGWRPAVDFVSGIERVWNAVLRSRG
jgi:UDP-glucose 4-epimerase